MLRFDKVIVSMNIRVAVQIKTNYYYCMVAAKGAGRKISRGGPTEKRPKNSTIKPLPGRPMAKNSKKD